MFDRRLVRLVAELAKDLKNKEGIFAPTTKELLAGNDEEILPKPATAEWGQFWYQVRRTLQRRYKMPAYCISDVYYEGIIEDGKVMRKPFHERPARKGEEEVARQCAARGYGKHIAGLYLGRGANDVLFRVLSGEQHRNNGKATGTNLQKTDLIIKNGYSSAADIMKQLTKVQIEVARLRPNLIGARLLRKVADQLAIEAKKLEGS